MAVFVKDKAGWDYMTRNPDGIVGRDLTKRTKRLHNLAVRQVGKKTHKLSSSITATVSVDYRGLKGVVGSDSKIALMHHQGTRPHVIVPKRAKTLRFMQNGQVRYAKRVFHPGHKPNRYLTDNLPLVVL